jgi:hypothetical protein
VFCCAFELPSLRNTQKRDKTKEVEEKFALKFLSVFFLFDMDFLTFNGVFELPSPKNAQKRTLKKSTTKIGCGGLVNSGI